MRPYLDGRTAGVLTVAALPPLALVAAGRTSAPPLPVLASILAIAIGLAILERALREAGRASVSVAASLLTLYGTGLLWHEVVQPGLTGLTFVAGAFLMRAWRPRVERDRVPALASGGALAVAIVVVVLLSEVVAGNRLSTARPAPLDSLFSSRHGLFFWTPLLTLAIFGLVRRAIRGHRDAAGALSALAVLALVNASLRPWWSGGFANARFVPALPLFALGLSELLDLVRATARRRPLRMAALAGALLVAWNLLLMAQYRAELIPRDDTVSFPAVAENSARLLAGMAGAPTAWPANWIFAARGDLPAARYDLLGGQDVLADGPLRIDVGDLESEAAWLGAGWSVRHPCGSSVCREVEGRAQLLLPVADLRPATVRVSAQGSGTLRLLLNGRPFAQASLAPAFAEVGATADASGLRPGPNELVLEVSPGGQAQVDEVRVAPLEGAR
jgi:hypothetical protein